MHFEEPEEAYSFDDLKQKNNKVKIRTAILFSVFILAILFIVKNDFSFSFLSATEDLGFACYTGNTLNKQDDNELEEIKANKVIEDNQEKFSKIKGFDGLEVDYKETYNGGKRPIVLINLSSKHPSHENLPEEMCNFELKLNYDF